MTFFGDNADGKNWLFVRETWLGGTQNSKWGEMGDHHFIQLKTLKFAKSAQELIFVAV